MGKIYNYWCTTIKIKMNTSQTKTIKKKMLFTEAEKTGILLGTISSSKKTQTYEKAYKYFQTKSEELKNQQFVLLPATKMWVCENTWSVYMFFFVTVDERRIKSTSKATSQDALKRKLRDMVKDYDDLFKGFDDIFKSKTA